MPTVSNAIGKYYLLTSCNASMLQSLGVAKEAWEAKFYVPEFNIQLQCNLTFQYLLNTAESSHFLCSIQL
jgi:hypothetical protein